MSQRNGDKAKFGKDRKHKIARRKRNRALPERFSNRATIATPKGREEGRAV